MITLKLSFRSVLYRYRQYLFLFFICFLGTALSLFLVFISKGMLKSLSDKARIYYGGDLVFMRAPAASRDQSIPDSGKYLLQLKKIFPSDAVISERFDFNARELASLYFEGQEAKLNVIKGIDFSVEKSLFTKLNFLAGNSDISKASNGALVSSAVCRQLGLSYGDEFTLYLRTKSGYINTVNLQVSGIFEDSSVFGMYTMYMDSAFLKEAFQEKESWSNRICIDFPQRKKIKASEIEGWNEELKKEYNMFRIVKDKQEFYKGMPYKKTTYALIPLKANLNEVSILEKAMKAVISVIIFIIVLIIVIGIASTYKVLVMKRINEIGIFMALGMKKADIIKSLLWESFLILFSASIMGVIFSLLLSSAASCFNLTFIPAFDIFLEGGSLKALGSFTMTIVLLFVIIFNTLLVVFFSVRKCLSILPVNALNATR